MDFLVVGSYYSSFICKIFFFDCKHGMLVGYDEYLRALKYIYVFQSSYLMSCSSIMLVFRLRTNLDRMHSHKD